MNSPPSQHRIPFWRDERILHILSQVFVFVAVASTIYWLYANMTRSLAAINLPISFRFLSITAGFDIGQTLIEYSRSSTYLQAYFVGVLNTVIVALWGNLFATVLGIIVGVSWLSSNWLVSRLARIYIEIFRNIPLLVFLIFWYGGVFLKLPSVQDALAIGPLIFSNRGVSMPWGIPTETFQTFLFLLAGGIVVAIGVGYVLTRQGKKTGRMPLITLWSLLTFLGVALVGWFVLPQAPLLFEIPAKPETGFNIVGGNTFSPEFMALLSGLVLYTAAFIGEVVRAGIQAVSKGQTEAARALGLTGFQTLRLVVFPQALRVIIPPLTSQYLNLTKNSSLAVAVGYPDLVQVYGTIINQSGRAVEMTAIMMATYLSFSLLTSLVLNVYNKRIQLVER
ncbi:MAG: ABC transporter permease subunit [Anaerolineales bacterium]|jgi:general L-amino acid transport system permease protein|nr:ABC transporter permease subunit [Anaerolineales bacterium]